MRAIVEFTPSDFNDFEGRSAAFAYNQLPDMIFSRYGLELPSRDMETRYQSGVSSHHFQSAPSPEMTDAVELVWSAEPDRRAMLLVDYCLSGDDEIAVWAVRSLAAISFDQPRETLQELIENSFARPAAKIAADECLCKIDRNWNSSRNRIKFIGEYIKQSLSETDAISLLERIEAGMEIGALCEDAVFMLSALAAINSAWPREARRYALLLAFRAGAGEENGEMFETLLYLVNNEPDQGLRLFAAYKLRSIQRLTNLQRSSISKTYERETDSIVKAYLCDAMNSKLSRWAS
jgi:hypothetical protein